jgi:hypothetical protein
MIAVTAANIRRLRRSLTSNSAINSLASHMSAALIAKVIIPKRVAVGGTDIMIRAGRIHAFNMAKTTNDRIAVTKVSNLMPGKRITRTPAEMNKIPHI